MKTFKQLKRKFLFFKRYRLRFYLYYSYSRAWTFFRGFGLDDKPIVITGMHRSGTSVIAGILNIAGMFIGRPGSIMKVNEDNPKGYFENLKVRAVNEIILEHYGLDWKSTASLPQDWHNSKFAEKLSRKVKFILNREFFGKKKWGVKDPRFCLTLKFWEKLFPGMLLVVVKRSDREIISSLEKRAEKPDDSERLLRHYLFSLEENIKGKTYKAIDFSTIIKKDAEEIKGLLDHVALGSDKMGQINDFISEDLYRSREK
jgi:hypothetical protein